MKQADAVNWRRNVSAFLKLAILFWCSANSAFSPLAAQEAEAVAGDQYIFSAEDGHVGCRALSAQQAETFLGVALYGRADFSGATAPPPHSHFATASFEVTMTGFSSEAAAAFQLAVGIWADRLVSPVPIRVDAAFASLTGGVLGAAGPTWFLRDFGGAPHPDTWYASALADKLAGVDLRPGDSDVSITFNSNYSNWYFGTDAQPPGNAVDFVTVALHELAHGLGFTDSFHVDGSNMGSWGLNTGYPIVYDRFTETGAGIPLLDTSAFPNPSLPLGAALQGDDVFFNGDAASGIRLFAPYPFQGGSSIAHLDEATFPRGNPDSLMTPSISLGEAMHSVGNVALGIFDDMGWTVNQLSDGCHFLCDVGIGTTDPQRQLHMKGSNAVFRMDRDTDTAAFMIVRTNAAGDPLKTFVVGTNASGANQGEFIVNDLGQAVGGPGVRRMTITNNGETHFTGTVRAPSFLQTSSLRFKEKVESLPNALDVVSQLRGVSFVWRETGRPSVGLIAEEVAEVLPEVVEREAESGEAAGVNYSALVAVLVEAVKTQRERMETQQSELDSLRAELAGLKSELRALRAESSGFASRTSGDRTADGR
jgi:hypothetical protein